MHVVPYMNTEHHFLLFIFRGSTIRLDDTLGNLERNLKLGLSIQDSPPIKQIHQEQGSLETCGNQTDTNHKQHNYQLHGKVSNVPAPVLH